MPAPLALAAIARDLAHVSQALAEALEAGAFDAAEAAPWPTDAGDLAAVVDARRIVAEAAARSEAAVRNSIHAAHGALGDLNTGARAMDAYLGGGALGPGWVDRHD